VVEDPNGNCGDSPQSNSVNLSVNLGLGSGITLTNLDSTSRCQGSGTTDFTLQGGSSANTYSWSLSGGGTISGTGRNAMVTWNNTAVGTFTVSVDITSQCGETTTRNSTVTINTTPSPPSITIEDTVICEGESVLISTSGTVQGYVYRLYRDNEQLIATETANNYGELIDWNPIYQPGNYYVRVENPSSNCGIGEASNSVYLTVLQGLGTNISLTNLDSPNRCQGSGTTDFRLDGGSNLNTYSWSVSGSATISGSGRNATVTWPSSVVGTSTITVTITSQCGEIIDRTATVTTDSAPAATTISIGDTAICGGQTTSVSTTSTVQGLNYRLFRNGTFLAEETATNYGQLIDWNPISEAGSYYVIVEDPNNNCGTSPQSNSVNLSVNVGLDAISQISGPETVCQGVETTSTYTANAVNATSYTWAMDPVSAGSINDGVATWNLSYVGDVIISVTAFDDCGNSDTRSTTVSLTDEITFYEDKDRDGFYISTVTGCTNPDPTIYVSEAAITASGDCNDTDGVLNPDTVWYEDTDGDGLGNPNVTLVQCQQPTGYVLTPDVDGPITEDPLPDLTGLDTQDMNTTFTVEPYTPTTTLSEIDALPANGKMASRVYYDGLGRPIQEIALHAGGISYEGYTGNDIVNYIEYDRFGRTVKRFSAYGKLDQTVAGAFETDAKVEQTQFYATGNIQNSFAHTANPFSETVFDRSPRNRAIRQASPGDNWSIASGNVVSTGYFFNVQAEVRYYKVSLSPDLVPSLVADGHYAANELVKTVVRDENWTSGPENTAEEFVNKDGQTVLKRTYVDGTTLSTYYVYDDYGNLTYVLPPKMEPDTATITTTLLNSLAFQYRYDTLRRQIEKRNPGVDGWESIVYDYEDRPVLAQDANMAINGQWMFTKYDKFGRPVYTGLYNSTQSRAQLQQLADNWVTVDQKTHNEARTETTTTVGGTPINYSNEAFPDANLELLSINYYDDYAITDGDLPTTPTAVMGQNVTSNTKGMATITWVKVLDGQSNSWNKTYTYYDIKGRALRVHTKNYQQGYTILDNELDFRGKVINSITQHQKDALDPMVSIKDSYTYDHMERMRTQNQALYNGDATGTPIEDKLVAGFLYDALGQLTKKYVEPASDAFGWRVGLDDSTNALETPSTNDPGIVVSREFSLGNAGIYNVDYDFSGDTSGVAYSIVMAISQGSTLVYRENLTATELGNAINFVAAVSGTYTVELNFISPNGTFSADSNFAPSRINMVSNTSLPLPSSGLAHRDVPALQMVDYEYNARGSMTQINDIDDLQDDLFAYRMHYDDPTTASGASPMYNGNVAEVQWRTQNDGSPRGYGYAYDALSRIKEATDNTGNYNISNISYDKNGNLQTLHRKGWGNFNGTNAFGDIDILNYSSYDGNKLLKVMDTGNTAEGFVYTSGAAVDYTYDANGNMTSDANKDITLIEYNHLDLPTKITFANGDNITYLYDAMGTKLKKTAFLNNNPTMTEYWNGFQYNMGELQFFAQPEGYVAVGETAGQRSFDYVYQYTDHLSNIRLSYSDIDENGSIDASTEIIKENNYYPFGMLHKSNVSLVHPLGTGYTYGFNGKELQEGGDLVWMDFGSRNYDPALGRWMNIDPQAGRYMAMSPFAAMGNNPVTFVDPNGEELVTTLIAGAVIGAWLGGATTAIMGGDMNDIGRNMLIGGLAGLASAGTAAVLTGGTNAVIAGTGFWNGAAVGGASGFAGGFTSGSLHSAFSGGDFGDILAGGLNSGAVGGLSGAAVGGVLGGIRASKHNGNFWTGDGSSFDYIAPIQQSQDNSITVGEGMEYSDTYGKNFSDLNFGKVKGVDCLKCDGTFPPGEPYELHGDRVFNTRSNRYILGTTVQTSTGHEVYIYKEAFTSPQQLYLTMQHEYIHVGYNLKGYPKNRPNSIHAGMRKIEYLQAQKWGFKVNHFKGIWDDIKPYYTPKYDPANVGFKIINHLPKLPK
jgi:RHS repeat-associated protein